MQAGRPERLVRVDVAETSEEGLVEEEWLEPALAPAKPLPELAQAEGRIERFGSQGGEDGRAANLGRELRGRRVEIGRAHV